MLREASAVSDCFNRAAEALGASEHRCGAAVRLPGRGRLLVTGDLHDNPVHLEKIVRLADLASSPDRHVVLHEIIHGEMLVNGLDLSHRMLARVAELVLKHPHQVHVLLGNHELAQMTGQRISKGAGDSVALFNGGLEFAFGDRWEEVAASISSFIRAMPLAVVSESGLLCAHSVPGPNGFDRFDAGVLERPLTGEDYRAREGAAYMMVWGRGYGRREIGALAARWGVKLFCLGHEQVAGGLAVRGPRVVVLNSDHDLGTVIPIDLGALPTAEAAAALAVRLRAVPAGSRDHG